MDMRTDQKEHGVRVHEFTALSPDARHVNGRIASLLQAMWDTGNDLLSRLSDASYTMLSRLGEEEGVAVVHMLGLVPARTDCNVILNSCARAAATFSCGTYRDMLTYAPRPMRSSFHRTTSQPPKDIGKTLECLPSVVAEIIKKGLSGEGGLRATDFDEGVLMILRGMEQNRAVSALQTVFRKTFLSNRNHMRNPSAIIMAELKRNDDDGHVRKRRKDEAGAEAEAGHEADGMCVFLAGNEAHVVSARLVQALTTFVRNTEDRLEISDFPHRCVQYLEDQSHRMRLVSLERLSDVIKHLPDEKCERSKFVEDAIMKRKESGENKS
jgi:hypothetical protein